MTRHEPTKPADREGAAAKPGRDRRRRARLGRRTSRSSVPVYGIDDVPPPLETLLYAWQHTLVDVSPYVLPMIVAGAVGYSAAQAAAMISACLVLMGLATFANATWGNRLPSVLGPSATDTGAMATAGRDLRRSRHVDGRLRRRAVRDRRGRERRAQAAAPLPAALRLRHRRPDHRHLARPRGRRLGLRATRAGDCSASPRGAVALDPACSP